MLIALPGPAAGSRTRTSWRVRVWTDDGLTAWSEEAHWESGLLDASDWAATWIEPPQDSPEPAGARATNYFIKKFSAPPSVVNARLYATAHGIYEAHLNADRVGECELTPGYTEYAARLQVQTYDVTHLIVPGVQNTLSFEIADGWYRGKVGMFRATEQWGDTTGLLAQLEIETSNGDVLRVATGPDWSSRPSSRTADLIDGETLDLRSTDVGFRTAELGAGWMPAKAGTFALDNLVGTLAPAVRRIEEIRPVALTGPPGRQIVDFGQNVAGWTRLERLGRRGTTVVLTYGEELDPQGDVTQKNLEPAVPMIDGRLPAGQIDRVVSSGDPKAAFEPRFTMHGFRYVRVEGLEEELGADDITAVVVHTDFRRIGRFACSDDRVNRPTRGSGVEPARQRR